MAWECVIEGKGIDNIKEDRKTAKDIEKYSVSKKAIYFDGMHIPIDEIKTISIHPSVYRPNHSCGRGIPVSKIRIDYGGDKPVVLMIEKVTNAEKVIQMIMESNKSIIFQEYVDPKTGEPPQKIPAGFH